MKGKIKWFNSIKGFGFIVGEDEKDYFVHFSQLNEAETFVEGDEVEFETKKTERGIQAVDVIKAGQERF